MLAQMQDRSAPNNGQMFSYINFWVLSMPSSSISSRFERTRAACLTDKTLNCKLVNADISMSNGSEYSYTQASLEVLIPHAGVEAFKKSVLSSLPGEGEGDVNLTGNSTRAESVESESSSANRRVEQLTAYRDRLTALSKRPNLSIEDVIRLEAEISRVQGELDDATKQKDDAASHLTLETIHIAMNERTRGPISSVWNRASDIFMRNVANVLEFLIGVIPWLPIIAATLFCGGWLWQRLRRRKLA